jgi:hypothetical protein
MINDIEEDDSNKENINDDEHRESNIRNNNNRTNTNKPFVNVTDKVFPFDKTAHKCGGQLVTKPGYSKGKTKNLLTNKQL